MAWLVDCLFVKLFICVVSRLVGRLLWPVGWSWWDVVVLLFLADDVVVAVAVASVVGDNFCL